MKSMDLSDCRNRNQDWNSWSVGRWFYNLNLERRHSIRSIPLWADFETVKEKSMIDESWLKPDPPEWQNDLYIFPSITSSQRARVDLIIARFEISSIFCEERKCDFGPRSVFPMGADQERYRRETIGVYGFYREEKIIWGSAFEIMYGWVK